MPKISNDTAIYNKNYFDSWIRINSKNIYISWYLRDYDITVYLSLLTNKFRGSQNINFHFIMFN